MTNELKTTAFSGIKPSGSLHLGNYLGAIKQWTKMQDDYSCIFCVVDYHAITVKQDPKELQKNIIDIVKIYLASGIDPAKSIIFKQSDISAHTELAWILNCIARVADLDKMTQFKDKGGSNRESVSVGLYDYPVLMVADVLLYNTEVVPVGDDQVQHIELARTLAKRFNKQFGETFKIPKPILQKQGARIMGLDDPANKMSKSAATESNFIALQDNPKIAIKKIIRAVTDSDAIIRFDKIKKPAISNLLTIYSLLTNESIQTLEKKYQNKGYGDFKKGLASILETFLIDFQNKFNNISDHKVQEVLQKGKLNAKLIAEKTLQKVKIKIGTKSMNNV